MANVFIKASFDQLPLSNKPHIAKINPKIAMPKKV